MTNQTARVAEDVIAKDKAQFEKIKQECITACNNYLADLNKRKGKMKEKLNSLDENLKQLRDDRTKYVDKLAELVSNGDDEGALRAEDQINAIDSKISNCERLQKLYDPNNLKMSEERFEEVKEAYKKALNGRDKYGTVLTEFNQMIDSEIERLKKLQIIYRNFPTEFYVCESYFAKIYETHLGQKWNRLTGKL